MVDLLFSHPGLRMAALATLVGGPAAAVTVFAFARLARRLSGWRRLWLVLGGVSAAAGVWTTHFVAVLASHEGLPQGYGLIAGLGGVAVLGAAVIAFSLDANRAKGAMQSLRDGRDAAVEQARLAQMAQDIAGLGHWRVDLATDEVAWSRQMYAIYGLSPDAPLKLRALIAMTHPEDARAGAERLADQRKTGRAYPNTSTRIIAKDGSTHWLQGSSLGEFDADGKLVALVGTLLDVTPQRRLEEDLRAARAEAEAAAAVKAEFLANMSHELRTPLTSILGFSDLLHEQADLSVNARRYVDRMHEGCRALLCTVNDILDFSKLEAGQVTIHWGQNPSNEGRNGKPAGVLACRLYYALGGIPANPSAWVELCSDTESPHLHELHNAAPQTVAYRAQYIDKKLQGGPFGDPVVCTVSV